MMWMKNGSRMINEKLVTGKQIDAIINLAFEEDIRGGDITTDAVIGEDVNADAVWISKGDGIIAGLKIAEKVYQKLDKNLVWLPFYDDGDRVQNGEIIAEIKGSCRAILTAERVALNFVQRMSGIATKTARMVRDLEGLQTKILDTRKTIPGLRALDKYAVVAGGGTNHRMGLYDMAMIKDNHIVAAGSIAAAVEKVRNSFPDVKIEVETTDLKQVEEAVESGADIIMLDNMSVEAMREAVKRVGGKAQTEASGNITGKNIRMIAMTGVDFISAGALTHSVRAFDISQEVKNLY